MTKQTFYPLSFILTSGFWFLVFFFGPDHPPKKRPKDDNGTL